MLLFCYVSIINFTIIYIISCLINLWKINKRWRQKPWHNFIWTQNREIDLVIEKQRCSLHETHGNTVDSPARSLDIISSARHDDSRIYCWRSQRVYWRPYDDEEDAAMVVVGNQLVERREGDRWSAKCHLR